MLSKLPSLSSGFDKYLCNFKSHKSIDSIFSTNRYKISIIFSFSLGENNKFPIHPLKALVIPLLIVLIVAALVLFSTIRMSWFGKYIQWVGILGLTLELLV